MDKDEIEARRAQVCTLKARGLGVQAIAEQLQSEGIEAASVKTIYRDLESTGVQEFVAELARAWLAAISEIKRPATRARALGEYLKWFSPPIQKVESKSLEVKVDAPSIDLSGLSEEDREAVIKAARIVHSAQMSKMGSSNAD